MATFRAGMGDGRSYDPVPHAEHVHGPNPKAPCLCSGCLPPQASHGCKTQKSNDVFFTLIRNEKELIIPALILPGQHAGVGDGRSDNQVLMANGSQSLAVRGLPAS